MLQDTNYVVCHYAEIGIKGKNRKFFEDALVRNIKTALNRGCFRLIRKMSGRILIELTKEAKQDNITGALQNVFGIAYFAFCTKIEADIEVIKNRVVEVLKEQDFKKFRVQAKRSDKTFELTSQQINEQVGAEVVLELKKGVDLTNPDITMYIDIVDNQVLLYTSKTKGSGGLPVGVSSKAVSLISGGIDSPVASWYAMKRGVRLVFAHFHAVPYVDKASVDKVKDIVKVLTKYQTEAKLYLIPFADIQKEILLKTKDKLRVVLYRRFMMRIAQEIAKTEKAQALITGESIGQVASQTLENIAVIEDSVSIPILRPLVGFDKQEIVTKAEQINTYNLSILPEQDCCSRFLPKHPETRARIADVLEQEKQLKVDELIKQAIKNTKIVTIC